MSSGTAKWNAKRSKERAKRRESLKRLKEALDKNQKNCEQKRVKDLVSATRKPISFDDLCDKMGLVPSALRNLIEQAKLDGIEIKTGNNHVALSPQEQIRTVQHTYILPTDGRRQKIGVISDLHLGSKYCLRAQIKDCVLYMYDRGIKSVLIPGDLLDGCYRHGVFELSHTGLEDQTRDLFETLPHLPGLSYHAITGNHDFTFAEKTGVNVGSYITGYFRERGRDDIHFYGDCGAFIEIYGAIIHLWHPLGGVSYALSYKLQKQIEKYGAGEKPHILLGGHVHQFAEVEERGVFGLFCPTFQASGSAFSKRLGGSPALGGVILEWEIAGKDLIRNFSVERRRYFEVETPQRIDGV